MDFENIRKSSADLKRKLASGKFPMIHDLENFLRIIEPLLASEEVDAVQQRFLKQLDQLNDALDAFKLHALRTSKPISAEDRVKTEGLMRDISRLDQQLAACQEESIRHMRRFDWQKTLHETAAAIAIFIDKNPGAQDKAIAKELGTTDENVRRIIMKSLKPIGFSSIRSRGYFPPPLPEPV